MTQHRVFWLASLLLLLSGFAFADPIDPTMVVNDPTCTSGFMTVTASFPFSFQADAKGGGTTCFMLDPESNGISTLDIETPGIFDSTSQVSCTSDLFNKCTVRFLDEVTDIYLSNNCDFTVCPPPINSKNRDFYISLDDTLGTDGGHWQPGQDFLGTANISPPANPLITPEPPSMLLVGSGLGALWARRRYALRFQKS